MSLYLLDTNMASHAIRGDLPRVRERLIALPIHSAAVSAVTRGELKYGLAKRGSPVSLSALVHEFLIRIEVLPWTGEVADVYGTLKASCRSEGINLEARDMMIAAHAVATEATLVTRDKSFSYVGRGLKIDDWSA